MEQSDPDAAPGPSGAPGIPGPSLTHASTSPARSPETPKRLRAEGPQQPKNLQACDRCRTKKIKCLPIDGRRGVCSSCHSAKIACTFDLPLTASRTKRVRRRLGLEAPGGSGAPATSTDLRDQSEDERGDTPESRFRAFEALPGSSASGRHSAVHREGPSSISYILHSMPTIPFSQLEEYARGAGYVMQRGPGDSQDGWIDVSTPSSVPNARGVLDVLHSSSWSDISSRLVENFLVHTAGVLPLVTRAQVPSASQPLLNAMAAVAAARSNVPRVVFEALRYQVQRDLEENDVMFIPTVENIQILLVASLVDDLAAAPRAAAPLSVIRSRVAAALRHAQDLGVDTSSDRDEARLMRCARVIDIWHAAKIGMSPVVPVTVLPLPARDDLDSQLTALTLVFGRLLALMYGRDGVQKTTNEQLLEVRDALDAWKANLPDNLRPSGIWSCREAGLLLLLYSSIKFLLYRPMMRWSFIVPNRLELNCDVPVWMDLLEITRGGIEWAANQEESADLLFFGPYALGICCLVQYHTWARRAEWDGAMMLDKARRDAVGRWLSRIQEGHLPLLRRQLGVVDFLYAITLTHREATAFDGPRGLNPTAAVLNRLPETCIAGVTFLRDASLPHGGVLVATQQAAREIKDLPPGTMILGGPPPTDTTPDASVGSARSSGTPNHHMTPGTATAQYLSGLFPNTPVAGPSVGPDRPSSTVGWEAMASMMFPNLNSGPPPDMSS